MTEPISQPDPAGQAVPGQTTSDTLINSLRVDIASTIKGYFPRLFCLTVAVAAILVGLIVIGFFTGETMATAVLAASIQVAFGMVIGFVCVYIGLMMTWFGIDAAYTIKGGFESGGVKAEGALKSASPGLLFALGGMVLIAVSLYKPIVYQQQGLNFSGQRTFGAEEHLPEPNPPRKPAPGPTRSSETKTPSG